MSDTDPVPCTRLRGRNASPVLHFSIAMSGHYAQPGRSGMSVCGVRGVIDQPRVTAQPAHRWTRLRDLRRCVNCHQILTSMNLLSRAEAALSALTHPLSEKEDRR